MNRILLTIVAAFAIALCGCKLTEPEAKAYVSLKTIQVTVEAAMQIYGEAYRAGKVTPELRADVHDIHRKYRIAFEAAVELARYDYSEKPPEELIDLAKRIAAIARQL
jgi:hypothetical protein